MTASAVITWELRWREKHVKLLNIEQRRRRCNVLQLHKQLSSFSLFLLGFFKFGSSAALSKKQLKWIDFPCPRAERSSVRTHVRLTIWTIYASITWHQRSDFITGIPRFDSADPKATRRELSNSFFFTVFSCHCSFAALDGHWELCFHLSIEFNLHLSFLKQTAEITISAWVFFCCFFASLSLAIHFCAYSVDRKPYTDIKWMCFSFIFAKKNDIKQTSGRGSFQRCATAIIWHCRCRSFSALRD